MTTHSYTKRHSISFQTFQAIAIAIALLATTLFSHHDSIPYYYISNRHTNLSIPIFAYPPQLTKLTIPILKELHFKDPVNHGESLLEINKLLAGPLGATPIHSLKKSQELLSEIRAKDPINRTAALLQAFLYAHTASIDSTIVYLRKTIVFNKEHIDLITESAKILIWFDRHPDAVRALKSRLQHDRDDPDINALLGLSHYHLKNYKEAIDAFKRSLNRSPNHIISLSGLGWLLTNHHTLVDKGIYYQEKAWRLNKKQLTTGINLGLIYLTQSEFSKAESYFREVLTFSPHHTGALSGLIGALKGHLNKSNSTENSMKKELLSLHKQLLHYSNDSQKRLIMVNLAQSYLENDSIDLAVSICEKAYLLNDRDASVKMALIDLYEKSFYAIIDNKSAPLSHAITQAINSLNILPYRTKLFQQKHTEYQTLIKRAIEKQDPSAITPDIQFLIQEFEALSADN
ncbi:MAG: tetratricopeptide repeat protein [Fibrobacterales bacterium]